ncbi:MAG: DNA-methyltransferase [Pseudoramibacter sp.]
MIKLINDDCFNILPEIADKSIDLVLTDPPYGCTNCAWDVRPDLLALWEQLNRIITDHGAICIFSDIRFAAHVISTNEKYFRYEWIVEKPNATGFLNARKMPLKAHDNLLVFYKHLPTYNPQWRWGTPYERYGSGASDNYSKHNARTHTESDGRRYPRNVIKTVLAENRGKHPTAKSSNLMKYFIKTYTNTNDTVLDCFMGSGSAGVAAVETGRNFIGIEKEKQYFDIASDDIHKARGENNARFNQNKGIQTPEGGDDRAG